MTSSGPWGPGFQAQNTHTPQVSAAVSYIYEAETGNITELGNQYRDRIERDFKKQGYKVKARRDMVLLVEDAETFGPGIRESDIWERAGVDVVVCGSYRINRIGDSDKGAVITVHVKAFNKHTTGLVEAYEIKEPLDCGWIRLAARIHGNVHKKKFETVVGTGDNSPKLVAELDRNPACYPPDTPARIFIHTEEGAHVYIFNVAADHTVSLLYPNQEMPDQPLVCKDFVFPPHSLSGRIKLFLSPLNPDEQCSEAFKIIASRDKMDFFFLPVPMNRIYKGAEGGKIKRLNTALEAYDQFSTVTLTYWVGRQCR